MSQYNRNGIQQLDNKKKPDKTKSVQDWSSANLRKQYDCATCDAYNQMCTSYKPLYDKPFVVPCKVAWHINEGATLEEKVNE